MKQLGKPCVSAPTRLLHLRRKIFLILDELHSRRGIVGLFAALGVAGSWPARAAASASGGLGPAVPFSWERVVAAAQALARRRYAAPVASTRGAADYDAAVRLTYGPARTLAGNVRVFPTSRATAPFPVSISVVAGERAREIIDPTGLFAGDGVADIAGFRLMDPGGSSDWMAFQGASYFRASGSQDQYGLSARGIAVDTALPHGEEFPAFTRFWLEQTGDGTARIYALLDGPSVTGAYRFDCSRSDAGVRQEVTATLFFRKDVAQLGLAAASSMFWYDQSRRPANSDWRPEIHDSDGLAILAASGERIWRPLENPSSARLLAFRADAPRGFGLLQRDQSFDHYQDDGAFYERRPSLWVEPRGDWGKGAVCLYEMPTAAETLDNIAMFWRPDAPARAGERRDVAYRLTWTSADPTADANARCVEVFDGPGGIPGAPPLAGARKFVFDFAGSSLRGLDRASGVMPQTDIPPDALAAATAYPVARTEARWRAMLDVRTDKLTRPEFRLFLKRGDAALSETVIKAI